MIYKLYPGSRMPHLVPGDICNIGGKDFPYIGEYNSKNDIPKGLIGVFKNLTTDNYELRHSKTDFGIIEEYNKHMLVQMANDPEPLPVERVNKEIFDPPILPTDNHLKVAIKQILHEMQIDINDYRSRFSSDNHINNMKRLMVSDANITFDKFLEWLDILGYSYQLNIIRPDGTSFSTN